MKLSRTSSPTRRAGASRAATIGLGITLATASVFTFSCKREKNFTEGRTFAGNVTVDAHTLNQGHDAYMQYCYACHGENGDGKGPSSYGLRPPPRDFTKGIFKFARVSSSDELPNDEDLVRIVKGGLHGTPMLAWDIPEVELRRVIQYIKTLTPPPDPDHPEKEVVSRWEEKKKNGDFKRKVVEPFQPEPDPWASKVEEGVARGKELYHLRAECMNCHPAYDTKEALYKLSEKAVAADPAQFKLIGSFRDDVYGSSAKDSTEYAVSKDGPLKILPPDFLFHPIRSAAVDQDNGKASTRVEDIYRIISFGIYPIMPKWKGAGLSESDLWAIAHYVKSLADMKGTAAAAELKNKIATQAAFTVPTISPAPETKPADGAAPGDTKAGEEGKKDEGTKKEETTKKDEGTKKEETTKKEGVKKEETTKKAAGDKKKAGGVRADDPAQ